MHSLSIDQATHVPGGNGGYGNSPPVGVEPALNLQMLMSLDHSKQ